MSEDAGGEREILLVRKPKGWTSFEVVKRVKRVVGVRKAGHAGTLDPLATGLLIVGVGPGTKQLGRFSDFDKEYVVSMRLGARTASLDADTPVTETFPVPELTIGQVESVLSGFIGEQTQIPPMYSAVKVGGRRLYKYARKGEQVTRPPRHVSVHAIRVVRFAPPDMTLNVVCSTGTYVRTLVDDIGMALGCGAYVTALERTRIGDFHVSEASDIEDLRTQSGGRV